VGAAVTAPPARASRPVTVAASVGRRDTVVFRVALAVVVLWVLDDAFVHPEAGASAGDHLSSGLVPTALALALGVVYPRLRPGLRAAAALVAGALATVAGVADGVRHVAVDRLAGDDVTAVLALIAGVVLLALGFWTLWRTRRLDEPRPRRYARRALTAVAAVACALYVVVPVAIALVATHKARSPVEAADLGRPYERVSFTTSDDHRLAGWYVPSRNGAAVIAFPGRSGPVRHAGMLARHGYGVLLLDRRGEGESGGDLNLFGWNGRGDLLAAVAFLARRPDVDPGRIGGLGLSVGGELLLDAAAHTTALRAVVSDGAGVRSLREHLRTPGLGRLQRWVSGWVAQTGAVAVLSNHGPPPGLVDLVRRMGRRPVLLIRALEGNEDEVLNRAYFDAARGPKALWEIPDGGHTGGLSAQPREYERRVVGFFDRALLRGV